MRLVLCISYSSLWYCLIFRGFVVVSTPHRVQGMHSRRLPLTEIIVAHSVEGLTALISCRVSAFHRRVRLIAIIRLVKVPAYLWPAISLRPSKCSDTHFWNMGHAGIREIFSRASQSYQTKRMTKSKFT
jgi:hypothetical protein